MKLRVWGLTWFMDSALGIRFEALGCFGHWDGLGIPVFWGSVTLNPEP